MVTLAGCGATDWFDEEEERLEGTRIPVLVDQRSISPDGTGDIRVPPPFAIPDWPQNGGYPNHVVHHVELASGLSVAWRADVGSGNASDQRITTPPIVEGGVVYAMDSEGQVSAFDAATGAVKWRVNLTPDEDDDGHFGGGLAFDRGGLFVTGGFGQAIGLIADTGEEMWRASLDAPVRGAPTVVAGRVLVVTTDNRLVALDAREGTVIWEHQAVGESAGLVGGASPAEDRGMVVAAFTTGELGAFDLGSGRMIWSNYLAGVSRTDPVATIADIRGNPVIDRGLVIGISNSGMMSAIEQASGRRVWTRDIAGIENPWVAGDAIYLLTTDAELVAIARATGRVAWVAGLPRYEDPEDREDPIVWSGPVLAGSQLYLVGSHGKAITVSPLTGETTGGFDLSDGARVPPIAAGGTLYIQTDDGALTAYR
ncbi:MAG: PQQ-binding-like beta-propeller repeat protein [Magnetospiraceae bacterium]